MPDDDERVAVRREAAVRNEEDPARRFEFRVSLEPGEIVAAFRNDPRVEWFDAPAVSFAAVGKRFQAWAAGERKLVVRHAVRETALGPSPNVHIEWTADPRGGTIVRGVFLKRAVPGNQRALTIATLVAIVGCGIGALVIDVLLVRGVIAGVLALIAIRAAASNRPTAPSMHHFGRPLWQLVGEKFIPHALGPAEDDPFRE
jgi:hypothetical protein